MKLETRTDEAARISADFVKWIKATFFPLWDKGNTWRFIENPFLSSDTGGFCDKQNKRIVVRELNDGYVLTHEICHAVTNISHGKMWATRMLKVAIRWLAIGEDDYALEIIEDVKHHAGIKPQWGDECGNK